MPEDEKSVKGFIPQHYFLPLEESLYSLGDAESVFFKSQTGIQDDEQLKKHIVTIQEQAFSVHPYPCIRHYAFTKLKISRISAYDTLLNLGKQKEGAIFLDIGCCFGNDVRKAVADGYPVQNVLASDLRQGFWDLGHKLFLDTPETFPVPFIPGDAFDSSHLEVVPPFTTATAPSGPAPDLQSLTSLNPLLGRVSAIHASSLFHLFLEERQLHLVRALAGLLSPESGSIIFGQHGSRPVKGLRNPIVGDYAMFCHSPDSWKKLWEEEAFEKGTFKVEATLHEVQRPDLAAVLPEEAGRKFYMMDWCVTRI